MDFDDIKQLINSDNERIIIIENGEPVAVLVSFDEYKKNFRKKTPAYQVKEATENKEETKKELTIDDLPF